MKMRRKLASLLAFAVVMGSLTIGAGAAEAETFTDMPDDWSRAALESAVENGLLNGSNGKINPQGQLTRAEMATIVNRAFGAQTTGDISGFTDVPASEWYYPEMQKAVHMGTFEGSNGKLNPAQSISRQEAMTVLARAVRLTDGADSALAQFSDAGEIASYAKPSVAALVERGYVGGSNGKLNPTASITRAEFAQMMDNLCADYLPEKFSGKVDGNAMVRTAGTVLDGASVKGDLIVGDGVGDGDVTLKDTQVEGRLVVRGGGLHSIIIIGSSSVARVVVSKPDGNVLVVAESGVTLPVVTVDDGKENVIIEGAAAKVEVTASEVPVVLQNAKVDEVVVSGDKADVTVDKTSEVKTLSVSDKAEGAAVSVAGKVTEVKTEAAKSEVKVESTGKVETVAVGGKAADTVVTADKGATVSKVETAASGTEVKGEGKVEKVEAQAGSEGTTVTTPGTGVTVDKDAGAVDTGKDEVKPGDTGKTEGTKPSTGGGSSGSSKKSSKAAFDILTDTDILGKSAAEMGVNLAATTSAVTGTLTHIAKYTGWWADDKENAGYFLPLEIKPAAVTDDMKITIKGKETKEFSKTDLEDGVLKYVFRVWKDGEKSAAQTLTVTLDNGSGYKATTYTLDLSALEFATAVKDSAELTAALSAQKSVILTENIALKTPAGNYVVDSYRGGVIDGNGKTITTTNTSWKGVIGNTYGNVTIKNLTMKYQTNLFPLITTNLGKTTIENVTSESAADTIHQDNNDSAFCCFNGLKGYPSAKLVLRDCVSNVKNFEVNSPGYAAIFLGGYADSLDITFENCVNNSNMSGIDVALFIGNPTRHPYSSGTVNDVKVVSCRNNGDFIGSKTAALFSRQADSSFYDTLNRTISVDGDGTFKQTADQKTTLKIADGTYVIERAADAAQADRIVFNLNASARAEDASTWAIALTKRLTGAGDTGIAPGKFIAKADFEKKFPDATTTSVSEDIESTGGILVGTYTDETNSQLYYVFDSIANGSSSYSFGADGKDAAPLATVYNGTTLIDSVSTVTA